MSNEPAVGETISPEGTQMNCNSWGTYEAPGTSETAALCNGGSVDGELWAPCPSNTRCREVKNRRIVQNARDRAALAATRSLPVAGQSAVRVIGNQGMPRSVIGPTSGPPTTIPQRSAGGPATIVSPETENPFLDTPRVLVPTRPGMHSPTFLPKKTEGWLSRLGKNMFQGVINSFGWHLHDYTQHVDLFPHDEEK